MRPAVLVASDQCVRGGVIGAVVLQLTLTPTHLTPHTSTYHCSCLPSISPLRNVDLFFYLLQNHDHNAQKTSHPDIGSLLSEQGLLRILHSS